MLIPLGGMSGKQNQTVLNISGSESDYNILTEAVAIGFNNAQPGSIVVNILTGADISGSSAANHAMRTGAINANSSLMINAIAGDLQGFFGVTNTTAGGAGGAAGDGLYVEVDSGCEVNVTAGGDSFGGGGGGGGGHGVSQSEYSDKGGAYCGAPNINGSNGSQGAAGVAGTNGTSPGGSCQTTSAGPGGAAGYAVRKNGNVVGTSGTFNGTVG